MVELMLQVKNPDSQQFENMGSCNFAIVPRIGEHIEIDINETGYLYKVIDVQHSDSPGADVADVYAVQVGKSLDARQNLFDKC